MRNKHTHNPTQGNFDVLMVDGTERPFVAFFVNKNRIASRDVRVQAEVLSTPQSG